jgi:hypothetical protein
MEHQPGRHPGYHGPVPATGRRGDDERGYGGQRMCDRALGMVSQQPEVQRYVIHIDGDRCDERPDIEAARRVDEARQDEQAQGRGRQMGDLIDGPGGPHAERNPAVGRVECQRGGGQQQRTSPRPDLAEEGRSHRRPTLGPVRTVFHRCVDYDREKGSTAEAAAH